jgi:hypothetical protein
MSLERVDTRGNAVGPGKWTMVVSETPISGDWGPGKNYYEFKFKVYVSPGSKLPYSERFPVWLCGPLLRALGCNEVETGIFEWDKEAVVGVKFDGEIVIEKGKDGKDYRKLRNPVAIAGFPKDTEIGDSVVPF